MTESLVVREGRAPHLASDAPIAFLWGGVLGFADVLFAARDGVWSGAQVARSAVVGALALGALMTVIGLLGRTLLVALRLTPTDTGLLTRRGRLLTRANLLVAMTALLTVAFSFCFIGLPVQPPLGLHRLAAGGLVLAAGVVVLVLLRVLITRAWFERATWLALVGVALFIEASPFYQFSRLWPTFTPSLGPKAMMSAMHTGGLVMLVAVSLVSFRFALPRVASTLGAPSPRVATALAALAVLSVLGLRPLLAFAPHNDRILLHERSRLAYRALELSARASAHVPSIRARAVPPQGVASAPPPARVRGVVMLMVDALRADMLERSMDGVRLTPALSALAARGTRFERAYATVPATHESVFAMLTGRRDAFQDPERATRESLGAVLRANGVSTVGIYGHEALDDALAPMNRPIFFGDGPTNKQRLTADLSLQHIDQELDRVGDSPFFIFAHFYDVHAHYLDNPEFYFGDEVVERYAAEVAYVDARIGRVFESIEHRGLSDETAILVVSDHGEELWDHGYRWHRKRVYEESAHVVFDVRVPFGPPQVVAEPVSLLDVAPTVLELLGVEVPAGLDGRSLLPVLAGAAITAEPVVTAAGDQSAFAVVSGSMKAVLHPFTGAIELFDLARDPRELDNLADVRGAEARHILDAALDWR
jgi:hypothetical protein